MREHIDMVQVSCDEDHATRMWLEDNEPYVRIDDARYPDGVAEAGSAGQENESGFVAPL